MFPPLENIASHLRQTPMLTALAALIVGILLAEWIEPSAVVAGGATVLGVAAFIMGRKSLTNDLVVLLIIVLTGALACTLRSSSPLPAMAEMEIEVERTTTIRNNTTYAEARIRAVRHHNTTLRSRTKVRLSIHDYTVSDGDKLIVVATARPFGSEEGYDRYMAAQGFAAEIFITEQDILHHQKAEPKFTTRLQHSALQRIKQLDLSPDVEVVARTVGLGDRVAITSDLRQNYSLSGGAHLLAVSGLHVGFLCMVLNIMLVLLTLLRNGQIVRSCVVVVGIWIYAAIAGFSPSVVRAAVMFSIVQASLLAYSSARTLNSLCFTAFAMLILDARTMHDAGFLLSFTAVAAIVEWVIPFTASKRQALPSRNPLRDILRRVMLWLIVAIAVAIAATTATLPLVSHLFGNISLWAIVLGPVQMLLCGVAVATTIGWVLMPIPLLEGVVADILELSIGAMNALAQWAAQSGALSTQSSISSGWCIAIYTLFVAFTLALWALPRPKRDGYRDFVLHERVSEE